jgi:SAM-dependent methyltransferase
VRDRYRGWRHERTETPTNLPAGAPPLPPARLVFRVAGTFDRHWFLEGGFRAAESIRAVLLQHEVDIARLESVLDFGCGCGRVLRHFQDLPGQVHGCDRDAGAIEWCQRNLRRGRFVVNAIEPPLPYRDGQFDLVYALSVFTHLPGRLQQAWMSELRRVMAPGGILLLSVHGSAYLDALSDDERREFHAGQLVVHGDDAGRNECGAYHPERYVRDVLARELTLLAHVPEGALGNPRQDLVVLRR